MYMDEDILLKVVIPVFLNEKLDQKQGEGLSEQFKLFMKR